MSSLEHVFRPDAQEAKESQPLSWLRSMIDLCKEYGPKTFDDPDAFWQMVREVEGLHDRAKAALEPQMPEYQQSFLRFAGLDQMSPEELQAYIDSK